MWGLTYGSGMYEYYNQFNAAKFLLRPAFANKEAQGKVLEILNQHTQYCISEYNLLMREINAYSNRYLLLNASKMLVQQITDFRQQFEPYLPKHITTNLQAIQDIINNNNINDPADSIQIITQRMAFVPNDYHTAYKISVLHYALNQRIQNIEAVNKETKETITTVVQTFVEDNALSNQQKIPFLLWLLGIMDPSCLSFTLPLSEDFSDSMHSTLLLPYAKDSIPTILLTVCMLGIGLLAFTGALIGVAFLLPIYCSLIGVILFSAISFSLASASLLFTLGAVVTYLNEPLFRDSALTVKLEQALFENTGDKQTLNATGRTFESFFTTVRQTQTPVTSDQLTL